MEKPGNGKMVQRVVELRLNPGFQNPVCSLARLKPIRFPPPGSVYQACIVRASVQQVYQKLNTLLGLQVNSYSLVLLFMFFFFFIIFCLYMLKISQEANIRNKSIVMHSHAL